MTNYTVLQGDCIDRLKELSDNSVDSCVTDPPYGLSKEPDINEVLTKWLAGEPYDHGHGGFMGKSWDSFVPHPDIWREVYRVLKPGGHALVFAGTRTQDLMTISLRLAGFEVRDVIEWLYFCLSDDTQALTREGWKSYKELTEDDYVMQWDSETGEMTWVKPEAIHVFPYNGKMLNFKSRATDQLVTPNHRMFVDVKKHSRNEYAGKYEVYEAKDLKRHWHKRLPLAGTYKGDKSIGINRAKLLGWFLTDAWVHGDGKAVMFSQSKPDTLLKLRSVLEEADVTYSEYTKEPKKGTHNVEHTFYVTGKDADWLLENYGDRRFNIELLDLVIDERKALLEALIDGDGSRKENGLLIFWSKNEDFLNFVRQLMFTLNMRTSVDNKKGCVRGSTRFNDTELQYKHGIHEVDYEGDVWCVTVPKGAFVVKRNEHVFITGNSGFPKSHDVSKAFDRRAGAEREVLGKDPNSIGRTMEREYIVGTGVKRTRNENITAPATDLAKQWDGWGTSTKPSHEPIIVVSKPKTVEDVLDEKLKEVVNCLSLFVKIAVQNSTLNLQDYVEELDFARNRVEPKNNIQDVLSEVTDMSQLKTITENINWSIALSCLITLGDRLKNGNTSTTETVLNTIIELKTLKYFQSLTTLEYIIKDAKSRSGERMNAETVAGHLNEELSRLSEILTPHVPENATSKQEEKDSFHKHEPIIVVRKPLVDADTGRKLTVADCVEKYGTGAINVDGCRIKGDLDDGLTRDRRTGTTGTVGDFGFLKPENGGGKFTKASGDKGRFPANAITTVDDAFYSKYFNVTANAVPNVTPAELSKKASKKDRDSDWRGEGISIKGKPPNHVYGDGLNSATKVVKKGDKDAVKRGDLPKGRTLRRNHHPTVKPTDLMAWLVRLITPPNGVVLDPFAGSGSTLVAAKREGFGFIGIEREPEYVEIIEARTGEEAID